MVAVCNLDCSWVLIALVLCVMAIYLQTDVPLTSDGSQGHCVSICVCVELLKTAFSSCQARLAMTPVVIPQMPRVKRAGCLICCGENTNRSVLQKRGGPGQKALPDKFLHQTCW